MSRDPAVEAARRVWARDPIGPILAPEGATEDAAREALKPIRELHRPCNGANCGCCNFCIECDLKWPCDTAKLAYSTDEWRTDCDQ